MDAAVHAATDNVIIGVRGGRVYKADPTSGSITAQSDYQQLGLGGACIVYDAGINKCFASAWNTGHYDVTNFGSVRNFYRIVPGTLAVDLISPFGSTFGIDAFAISSSPACGVSAMKNVGGTIFGLGWSARNEEAYFLKFLASAVGTNSSHPVGDWGYPSVAYAKVGGTNDVAFCCGPGTDQVISWDFTASAGNTSTFNTARGYLAIEYVGGAVNRLFVTREFQFIDLYDTSLNFIGTIDTGRSTFQGVNILLNPNDNLLYVAGGVDGTVVVITPNAVPASNTFVVKSGFDLPWNFAFTPSVKFCVQQGNVALKPIV